MSRIFFIGFLVFCVMLATISCSLRKSHGSTLEKNQKEKAKLKKLLNHKFTAKFKQEVAQQVLADIKKNGLYLGNRWRIAEEGTGSFEALVFRDMTISMSGTDRRYVMTKGRYVDL